MTVSEEVRVWRFRVRGFAVAGAVCLALIFLLKILDPTEFVKSFILWYSFGCAGYIAPTGIGKILEKMKYGAADQRKPLAQNGINCTRLLARCWRPALGHRLPITFKMAAFPFALVSRR